MSTTTTFNLHGRDLTLTPPDEYLDLSFASLLTALFGSHLPTLINRDIEQDKRYSFLRTYPMHFTAIKQALRQQGVPFTVEFEERPVLPFKTTLALSSRPYQDEALANWLAESSTGVVVLPTGAGKTFVAAMAIHETGLWTLAVVPTIDLLQQWRVALSAALSVPIDEIGTFGGGEKEIKPITIITYDSAALYPRELRSFGLLIFDKFCVIEQCKLTISQIVAQPGVDDFVPVRKSLVTDFLLQEAGILTSFLYALFQVRKVGAKCEFCLRL